MPEVATVRPLEGRPSWEWRSRTISTVLCLQAEVISVPQFEAGSFFKTLFDLSFRTFVTPRIVSMVYVIGIAFGVLAALTAIIGAFVQSVGQGLFVLVIVAPIGFLLFAVYLRVVLEVFIAVIRVAENTARMSGLAMRPAAPGEAEDAPEGHA